MNKQGKRNKTKQSLSHEASLQCANARSHVSVCVSTCKHERVHACVCERVITRMHASVRACECVCEHVQTCKAAFCRARLRVCPQQTRNTFFLGSWCHWQTNHEQTQPAPRRQRTLQTGHPADSAPHRQRAPQTVHPTKGWACRHTVHCRPLHCWTPSSAQCLLGAHSPPGTDGMSGKPGRNPRPPAVLTLVGEIKGF